MALPRRISGKFSRPVAAQQHHQQHQPPWEDGDDDVLTSSHLLARMLEQISHSTRPFSLQELARRPDYGQLIWKMRLDGWDLRMRALQRLSGVLTTPDPRAQSAFSSRQILAAALQHLDGMPVWFISNERANGLGELRDYLSQTYHVEPLYAWVQAFADGQVPCLVYDLRGRRYAWRVAENWRHPRYATLQAAQCLGILLHGWGYFRSPSNPGKQILPPTPHADKPFQVPVHTFMKAFLGLGDDCPQDFGCECNMVNWHIRNAAQAAAWRAHGEGGNTDMLQPDPYEQPPQPAQQPHQPHTGYPYTSAPLRARTAPPAPVQRAQVTPLLPPLPPDGDDDSVPDETDASDRDSGSWSVM